MINMGARLKQIRIDNKLTQQQLAELFGTALSSISTYESGSRKPSYEILRKYASHFHVTTDYILGLDKRNSIDISDLSKSEIDSIQLLISEYRAKK